jgi:plasmid stabilization system protein ParE
MLPAGRIDLWSPAAKQDLRDIWARFAEIASLDIADNLLREINSAGALIAKNPLAWRTRDEIMPSIRPVPLHPYTILYRVVNEGPEIVRVLHERRHFTAILSNSDPTAR